jgi:hypothetical protein
VRRAAGYGTRVGLCMCVHSFPERLRQGGGFAGCGLRRRGWHQSGWRGRHREQQHAATWSLAEQPTASEAPAGFLTDPWSLTARLPAAGKNGVIAPDQTTFDYVRARTQEAFEPVYSDGAANVRPAGWLTGRRAVRRVWVPVPTGRMIPWLGACFDTYVYTYVV